MLHVCAVSWCVYSCDQHLQQRQLRAGLRWLPAADSPEFPSSLQVHAVVSKMMMEEGFAGSWDQPTRSVVMHNAQPSRLQTLASELSDRAAGGPRFCLQRCINLLT